MDSMLRAMMIFLSCLVIGSTAFWIIVSYSIYQKNVKRFNALIASRVIKPDKVKFAFSWFVCILVFYIPAVLIIGLIEKEFPYSFAWLPPLLLLSFAPAAYPYYNIAILNAKINGATKWGWLSKRTEINFHEIDKDKILRQHLGRKLGITVIHSTSGVKILTLGLDDQQLADILDLAN